MYKLVIVRHGQSVWNAQNIFTGWTDVELSPEGIEEARLAGLILKKAGYVFDMAFTSVLSRAIKTLEIVLKEMELSIPIEYSWRLNERHYGALQGMNKFEIRDKYGETQFMQWRRGYAFRPPELEEGDPRSSTNDPKYKDLKQEEIPMTESLQDTEKRVRPYWDNNIVPAIKSGKKVLISAHGNSIRAIIKFVEELDDKEIEQVEIPTGVPMVYEFDEDMKMTNKYYLDETAM
ncbi:2,3-diphosphoglycerate-dependent phosphoglycerate mutase [bacterium]|nr:2,3-diphosphoglycerate-dependent phosphoglycerate mutase [bacterium]